MRRYAVVILLLLNVLCAPVALNAIPRTGTVVLPKDSPTKTQVTKPVVQPAAKTPAAAPKLQEGRRVFPVLQKTFSRFVPYYVFIFLGCFIMIAVIRILDPPYLRNLLTSSINLKLLQSLFKEGLFGFNITNLLLDVLCICMFSIAIQVYFFASQPQYFLWILAFTSVGYFLKLIIIQFLANIFMGRGEALVHLLMHLQFTRLLGLVLLPVLFTGLYQTAIDVNLLLHIIIISVFVLYTGWLFRLYVQMKSVSPSGFFYLFLYLCTIELSPLAILLKDYIR